LHKICVIIGKKKKLIFPRQIVPIYFLINAPKVMVDKTQINFDMFSCCRVDLILPTNFDSNLS